LALVVLAQGRIALVQMALIQSYTQLLPTAVVVVLWVMVELLMVPMVALAVVELTQV
jgi:hypothetical protein